MFCAQYTAQKMKFFTKRFFGKLNHINRSLQSPVIIRSPVMTNAYNNWGDIGSFPECFKTAEAIPTYKKGKAIEKTNYRPISILSNISTIYERLMHDNMGDYFNDVWVRLLYLIKTWRKTCDNHGVFAAVMTACLKPLIAFPIWLRWIFIKSDYLISEKSCANYYSGLIA